MTISSVATWNASHTLSNEDTVCNRKERCKHHRQQGWEENALKQRFYPRLPKVYTVSFLVFDLISAQCYTLIITL